MANDRNVSVGNFDEMRLGLKKELDVLRKKMGESLGGGVSLNMDVRGIKELITLVMKLIEVIAALELNPTLQVPEIKIPKIDLPTFNLPEVKIPEIHVPEPRVTVNPAAVNIDLKSVVDALENLKYLSDQPDKPLTVRMSDGQKFIKAITALQKATDNLGVVYAGSSGLTTDDLKNYSGRLATDVIYAGSGASLTPKFATIAAASSGNNTIVNAVTGKKIRVLQMDMIASGSVNAKFQSGAGGTDLTGLAYMTTNTGLVRGFSPIGWFETAAGALLNLNLSGATAVGGSLVYIEV